LHRYYQGSKLLTECMQLFEPTHMDAAPTHIMLGEYVNLSY
jgi:hypothetical protein